ncbi:hypothetical protein [Caudoviricetes sp.]|nr:hypothetical protein [Caudoviricetes sp.]
MGGVVSAVASVVSDVVETVGDAVEDVGNAVIDNIVEPVAHAVENTVQSIADDPIGSMAKIAAVATGQFELLPLISAADTLAHGGSLEQAALNAGVAYIGGEVGGEIACAADSGLAGGMGAGATSAALKGKDITQGALTGGINYGINSGISCAACSDCGSSEDCAPQDQTDTCQAVTASDSECSAQGCASTQDKGGLPTVISKADAGVEQCAACDSCLNCNSSFGCDNEPTNCMGEVEITGQREACADCESSPYACNTTCQEDCTSCCAEDCTSCCGDQCGDCTSGGLPFKIKIKGPKGSKKTKIKTPRIKNPKIPGVTNAMTLAGGLGSLGGAYGCCSCAPTCGAVPWLDTKPEVLKNQLHVDKRGNLTINKESPSKLQDIYGRMDQCLAQEFQDRFGGVPQVDITAGGALGGNFAHSSGYASGGCVTGCSMCLNQSPKYMPKFVSCGPDVITTSGPSRRQAIAQKQLKQMAQQISNHGNMGGLASGGLPKKYMEAGPKGHNPEFVTGLTGYYACGGGTGQSDDIKAVLHDGDYVMDADVVAALGDGSSKAGKHVLEGFLTQIPHKDTAKGQPVPANIADGEYVFPASFVTALGGGDNKAGSKILDGLREKLRAHKRSAPTSKIPPKAKSPLDYIKAKG